MIILLKYFQLHYLRLPKDISEDYVILMDCTVSTGAAAMMAVRVLLVREPDCSLIHTSSDEFLCEASVHGRVCLLRTTTFRRTRSCSCLCSWQKWESTPLLTLSLRSKSSPPLWTRRSMTSFTSYPA